MFSFKHTGHSKSSDQRKLEAGRAFPGNLDFGWRLLYISMPEVFSESMASWIANDILTAVRVFDKVRASLLKLYQDLEETFIASQRYHQKLALDLAPHSPVVQRRTYINLSRMRFDCERGVREHQACGNQDGCQRVAADVDTKLQEAEHRRSSC